MFQAPPCTVHTSLHSVPPCTVHTSLHRAHLLAQCTSLHSTNYPAQGTPPRTVHTPLHSTQHFSHVHVYGRRKDFFQGGPTRRFFQRFPGVEAKSGEISFFPLETKKTTIFKIQRGQGLPPSPLPTPITMYS